MAATMRQVQCDSPCNFTVKSHDDKEIIEIVKKHAREVHNMAMTDAEVKSMIQSVD